jgi:Coenzyme PQQ synthesis protein D (PqqD)
VLKLSGQIRSTHNRDGAIVLDILHGEMFRLNFVGSRILELLKQGSGEPEIAGQLAREFGIDRATAEADVHEFLETLEKHHLLTVRDGNCLA